MPVTGRRRPGRPHQSQTRLPNLLSTSRCPPLVQRDGTCAHRRLQAASIREDVVLGFRLVYARWRHHTPDGRPADKGFVVARSAGSGDRRSGRAGVHPTGVRAFRTFLRDCSAVMPSLRDEGFVLRHGSSLPGPVAPRSSAACRRPAGWRDVLGEGGASSTAQA